MPSDLFRLQLMLRGSKLSTRHRGADASRRTRGRDAGQVGRSRASISVQHVEQREDLHYQAPTLQAARNSGVACRKALARSGTSHRP